MTRPAQRSGKRAGVPAAAGSGRRIPRGPAGGVGAPDAAAVGRVAALFEESARLLQDTARELAEPVAGAAALIVERLRAGGTLICCGNGGSAADAQHIAAELGGRFRRVRPGLPAVALTVNSSMLTAIANDFGFDQVFARQLEAIGRPGDVLLAISTSGRSPSVLRAAETARRRDIRVIALTGAGGGDLGKSCDLLLAVPSTDTARIQEAHITIGHLLCELAEAALFPPTTAGRGAGRARRG